VKRSHLILALCLASSAAVPALADTFTFNGSGQTGSVQHFTAPTAGEYDIVAFGASGGNTVVQVGGLGAEMGGDFNLTAGEVLDVYVGGTGQFGGAGGGGGGSFVVVASTTAPLVIAGGGGGGSAGSEKGGGGQTSVVNAGKGGAGNDGGGGGGFNAPVNGGNGVGTTTGGSGFPSLTGGNALVPGNGNGGYGGGGGAGGFGGGGGGGYGGGAGGISGPGTDGGLGGGSFLDSSVMNALEMAGENSGNGMVTITPVVAAVPEPGSISLLAFCLVAIPGLRRLARSGLRRTAR
jgi:hypothetical protein